MNFPKLPILIAIGLISTQASAVGQRWPVAVDPAVIGTLSKIEIALNANANQANVVGGFINKGQVANAINDVITDSNKKLQEIAEQNKVTLQACEAVTKAGGLASASSANGTVQNALNKKNAISKSSTTAQNRKSITIPEACTAADVRGGLCTKAGEFAGITESVTSLTVDPKTKNNSISSANLKYADAHIKSVVYALAPDIPGSGGNAEYSTLRKIWMSRMSPVLVAYERDLADATAIEASKDSALHAAWRSAENRLAYKQIYGSGRVFPENPSFMEIKQFDILKEKFAVNTVLQRQAFSQEESLRNISNQLATQGTLQLDILHTLRDIKNILAAMHADKMSNLPSNMQQMNQ